MTLTQLRYLVAIVDSGLNITTAARRVNATQPGLSKQLKQIEEELGFLLFIRRGKSLEGLSAAGAQVVERARVILAEAANIRALAANLRQEPCGDLRIATTHTQARFVLPPALAAFKARFPEVRLHLEPLAEREALDRLDQDRADVAIVSDPERPQTAHLALPIYRWRLLALAGPGHRLAADSRPLDLARLAEAPLVTYEAALQPSAAFARAFALEGLTPKVACTARDSDLIKTYVRAGLGVGVLAEMAVGPEDADLQRLDLGDLFPVQTAWLVLRRDRTLRNVVLGLAAQIAPGLGLGERSRGLDLETLDGGAPSPPLWPAVRNQPAPVAAFA